MAIKYTSLATSGISNLRQWGGQRPLWREKGMPKSVGWRLSLLIFFASRKQTVLFFFIYLFFFLFQVWIPVCFFVVAWDQSCKCTQRADAGMLWLLVLSVMDRSCCFGKAEVTWQIRGISFFSFSGALCYVLNLRLETNVLTKAVLGWFVFH